MGFQRHNSKLFHSYFVIFKESLLVEDEQNRNKNRCNALLKLIEFSTDCVEFGLAVTLISLLGSSSLFCELGCYVKFYLISAAPRRHSTQHTILCFCIRVY